VQKKSKNPVLYHVPFNFLLTYDSYGPVHNRFHRGECITWASGGKGALDTPGALNGIQRSECHLKVHKNDNFFGFDFEICTFS
jgi:hypothetical protein